MGLPKANRWRVRVCAMHEPQGIVLVRPICAPRTHMHTTRYNRAPLPCRFIFRSWLWSMPMACFIQLLECPTSTRTPEATQTT